MDRPATIAPAPLPAQARVELVEALSVEHDADPFGPADVRLVARRVVEVAQGLGLHATIHRGGVDLGGAELDHVFVVVCDRVVDVALPVHDDGFVAAVRAWVAGDVELPELSDRAAVLGLEARVLGEYPQRMAYRGLPVWGSAA